MYGWLTYFPIEKATIGYCYFLMCYLWSNPVIDIDFQTIDTRILDHQEYITVSITTTKP